MINILNQTIIAKNINNQAKSETTRKIKEKQIILALIDRENIC